MKENNKEVQNTS